MPITAVPATAPFMPTNITGCRAWFDAFDASYTLSGTTVTGWTNKSGNANASTGSGTVSINLATLNGKSSVRFPAGTNYLNVGSLTYTTSYRNMFFLVTVGASGSIYVYLTTNNDLISGQCYSWSDGDIEINKWGTLGLRSYPTGYFSSTAIVSICTSTGGNTGIWVNGVSQTLTNNNVGTGGFWSTGTASPSLGGASGYTTGTLDMYELLQYDGSLTTIQRQQVEGYLAWKWGLQASLPAGHPHRAASPTVPAPSTFTPRSIAGCRLWVDATDPAGTGVMPANGASFTTWVDKSGTGTNLSGGSTLGTFNGLRIVNFNGVYFQNGDFTQSGPLTIIFIGKMNVITEWHTFSDNAGGLTPFVGLDYEGNQRSAFRYGGTGTTNVEMWTLTYSSSDNTVFNVNGADVRGQPTGYGGIGFTNGVRLGLAGNDTAYLNGWIGEYFIYNTALTTTQYQQMEGYLAWKWGIQASLPGSHPYATVNPNIIFNSKISAIPFYTQFKPTSAGNCVLWLDATDPAGTGVQPENNSTLASWVDKSGLGNNVTQATTANQPTYVRGIVNGNPVVRFDGVNDSLQDSSFTALGTSNVSFWLVERNLNGSLGAAPISFGYFTGNEPAGGIIFQNNGGLQPLSDGNNSVVYTSATARIDFLNRTNVSGGVGGSMYLNGNSLSKLDNSTGTYPTTFVVGLRHNATIYSSGDICEVLIFTGTPTATQRQSVESYLAAKWGLTSTLPNFTSPLQIPGCRLWLDGADPAGTGILPATGPLATWIDKSGSGNNGVAYTGVTAPSYSPTTSNITFSGSSATYYSVTGISTGTTSETLFIVLLRTTSVTNTPFGSTTTSGATWYMNNTNPSFIAWNPFGGNNSSGANLQFYNNVTNLVCGTNNSGTNVMYLNGTGDTSGSTTFSSSSLVIGNSSSGANGITRQNGWNGTISEVIYYNTVLTTAQRQQVEGYLAWKWGIKGSPQGIALSVTNSGSGAYLINGASNPTLSFVRGNIYILNVNASGHPFWIQTVSGAYSSGNVYSTGVTNNGTQIGTIIFEVPSNAPQLYYVCQNHSSMAGSIVVSDGLPATHPHFAANPYHPHFTAPAGRNPIVAALIPTIPRGIGYFYAFYPNTATFTHTGANQSLLIPASINPATITVYIWGAGGGGGHTGTQGATAGGAGAYVQGTLTVTPNNSLTIIVGGGGTHGSVGVAYGGGGSANAGGTYGGGGGRSAIQLSGTELVNAGGGGGAGYDCSGGYANFSPTINGGAGYPGLTGASWPFDSGAGGTQTAGGAGGPGNASSYGVASPGTYLAGGAAAPYAGGGGSGYYGGGGGNTNDTNGAGGGGGSSYTTNPAFTLITGSNSSNGYSAPASASPYYVSGVAAGSTNMTTGGNGRIVVTYTTIIPPTISSGGTITLNGTNRVHSFTTVGTTQFTLSGPASVQAQLLVVGGGGSGGGWNDGGGGGAGGLVYVSSMTLTAGTYSIIVGAGGTGLVYNSSSTGNNGENSSAFGYTGIGGGGGGGGGNGIGLSGGCGGGGGFAALAGAATQAGGFPGCRGTSATGGVGQSGGAGGSTTGGGGGGMGSTGTNLVGGSGLQYSISGTAQFYAAGGGPGTDSGSVQPLGGSGIGGNGGWRQSNPGTYPPTPGAANTGSGGGGFTDIISGGSGFYGAGGSGIVIISFPN